MSVINSIRSQIAPIHPQGYPFIGGFALVAIFLFWLAKPLGWIGVLATIWCAYFFRDPKRVIPIGEGLVVSPADGRISQVALASPPPELEMGPEQRVRVSIFMNVFDVHVNRAPVAGEVRRIVYKPGKFLNADLRYQFIEHFHIDLTGRRDPSGCLIGYFLDLVTGMTLYPLPFDLVL